jgi:hypothetical protein
MSALRTMWTGWKKFGHILGQVQTAVLLAIIYHIAIGPISMISRLLHRDLLGLRPVRGASHAVPLPPVTSTVERALKQF